MTFHHTWQGGDASIPLAYLGLEKPFVTDAAPLAARTGTLTITFSRNGREIVRRFVVLNDRLLRDVVVTDTYYWANIDELLEKLRSEGCVTRGRVQDSNRLSGARRTGGITGRGQSGRQPSMGYQFNGSGKNSLTSSS